MDSDSESQDSDDGRRFRFETTRKDATSLPKRKISPQRSRHTEQRRSRSRDRSSRDDRSRHSKDDHSRRNRSPNDRDTNNRHSTKDRSSKDSKNSSRDSSSRRQPHEKDSRSHRTKDSSRGYDSKESRDSKDRDSKHKSKAREKHKKHSRDRSRERSSQIEEAPKKEDKVLDSISVETEEIRPRTMKRQRTGDSEKVNLKSVQEKPTELASSNPVALSDIGVSRTSATVDAAPARKKPKSFFDRIVNKGDNGEDSSLYGPSLPPSLEKKMLNAREAEVETLKYVERAETPRKPEVDDSAGVIGPALPPGLKPASPVQKDESSSSERDEKDVDRNEMEVEEEEDDDDDAFGPALPPHLANRREIVGPVLPKDFVPSDTRETIQSSKSDEEKQIDEDDDDDDVVGPLPPDHPAARGSYVQMQLEHRARQVKEKFRNKTSPEKNKREEWMTELPPAHAVALGLGSIPRKFKTSEGPDLSDRSMWTDTPADRLRKEKEKEENRFVPSDESRKKSKKSKDKDAVETNVEEEKQESLLDMHLKNLKKKKKKLEKEAKELGLSTRRPFDRDIDLQANRLDEARKKKIFQKASRLNDRFTAGKI
ncbi:GPALPP motifs-containing protein 1 [Nasonia vitripennis]|uniref:DUF3752 domain-containing protein n=1 Tax=Nasonia vitripennis TaxID=7425 RepID=A0A7M7G7L6_NASVI|nr:GPALPP motifs-containing protein 1 [Nasonia vitripennis]